MFDIHTVLTYSYTIFHQISILMQYLVIHLRKEFESLNFGGLARAAQVTHPFVPAMSECCAQDLKEAYMLLHTRLDRVIPGENLPGLAPDGRWGGT